ncbi:MAG: hypothetical protein WC071_13925 [Victivallaceae bacterium]
MNWKNKTRKTKFIQLSTVIILTLLILAAGLVVFSKNHHAPDPKKMTPLAATKYLATKDFASLPEAEQAGYLSKLQGDKNFPPMLQDRELSDAEKNSIRRNTARLMHKQMKKRISEFFTMSPEEQNKTIDNMINDMKKRRLAGGAGGPGGPPPNGNRDAMMQNMLENSSSTERAQMNEIHKRIQQRMQNRQ